MSKPTCRELLEAIHKGLWGNASKATELAARVERVLALHQSADKIGVPKDFDGNLCLDCGETWPCATVRLLDGEE